MVMSPLTAFNHGYRARIRRINDERVKNAGEVVLTGEEDICCFCAIILHKVDKCVCRARLEQCVIEDCIE